MRSFEMRSLRKRNVILFPPSCGENGTLWLEQKAGTGFADLWNC